MADGFERVSGTPTKTFKSDFVLNNTTSQQHKLGGTLGTVTMEATSISSLGTRTLTFYDASGLRYLATCDSGDLYNRGDFETIGTSGIDSTEKLAIAIVTSIEDAIDTGIEGQLLQVSVSRNGSEFTVTRSNINNGAVSITSDQIGGTLVDEENVEPVGSGNTLDGTVPNEQVPFSVGIKGPTNLRGRTTAYKVER